MPESSTRKQHTCKLRVHLNSCKLALPTSSAGYKDESCVMCCTPTSAS